MAGAMRTTVTWVATLLCATGCGAMYPVDSLEGRWTGDVRAQQSDALAESFTSHTVALSFNRDGTYSFELRAVMTADASIHPGCTMTQVSRGAWSTHRDGRLLYVSATASAGTTERTGCRDVSSNIARRAATEAELLSLRTGYAVSEHWLLLEYTPVLRGLQLVR